MSDDIHAEALERYELAAALMRRGWVTRAELESEIFGQPAREIYFSPFRNSLVIREAFAVERRAAGERDRREWIEDVRRRLGLVTEVHRCRVWKRGEKDWAARCLRPGCPAGSGVGWAPSQQYALGDALAHAGTFLPLPPEETQVTELDALAFDAAWGAMRAQQDAFAAALPERANAIAERINGILPDGLRFEWVADGE